MAASSSPLSPTTRKMADASCNASFIVSDGTRIAYRLNGPSDSPNKILLIMGFLTDGAAWAWQSEYFGSKGYQVVYFDNRGVAKSSTPGYTQLGSYTTKRMARDALELASHLQWPRFHVVGVSMGGMIAMEMALRAPERIRSLTLAVTHAGGPSSVVPWVGFKRMVVSVFTNKPESRLDSIMNMLYSEHTLKDEKLASTLRGYHVERIRTRIPPKFAALLGHTLAVHRHYVSYNHLLRIRYARFPTQVIVGDEDHLVRMSNSHMLARVLGAKLIVVPHGGHGMFAEHPDKINEYLENFFVTAQDQTKTDKERRERDNASPGSPGDDADLEAEQAASQVVAESEDGSASGAASPYSLEEHALKLACGHTAHCTMHAIAGFIGGFVPAVAFRYVFWSSIAMSTPVVAAAATSVAAGSTVSFGYTRTQQAVRFGLLVGSLRCAWRALRCLLHTYRARRWALQHKLLAPKNLDISEVTDKRKGIPRGAGFEFPWHSLAVVGACAALLYQQKLLHGILSTD